MKGNEEQLPKVKGLSLVPKHAGVLADARPPATTNPPLHSLFLATNTHTHTRKKVEEGAEGTFPRCTAAAPPSACTGRRFPEKGRKKKKKTDREESMGMCVCRVMLYGEE